MQNLRKTGLALVLVAAAALGGCRMAGNVPGQDTPTEDIPRAGSANNETGQPEASDDNVDEENPELVALRERTAEQDRRIAALEAALANPDNGNDPEQPEPPAEDNNTPPVEENQQPRRLSETEVQRRQQVNLVARPGDRVLAMIPKEEEIRDSRLHGIFPNNRGESRNLVAIGTVVRADSLRFIEFNTMNGAVDRTGTLQVDGLGFVEAVTARPVNITLASGQSTPLVRVANGNGTDLIFQFFVVTDAQLTASRTETQHVSFWGRNSIGQPILIAPNCMRSESNQNGYFIVWNQESGWTFVHQRRPPDGGNSQWTSQIMLHHVSN